jgi:oligopeptide/dipeptide ABC transporter ATP-binding protein
MLEVANLRVDFKVPRGVVAAVRDVSFTLAETASLAVVGESGSGKSVTARAIMGLLPKDRSTTAGSIRFQGSELVGASEATWRALRGQQVAMVFQDATAALNPLMTVGEQCAEVFRRRRGLSRRAARTAAMDLFDQVKIPDASRRFDDYPHEFSGGMRQRVVIAIALALEPRLLIADEPTTALDVTIQAQIMDLLLQLREQRHMALMLITHDLGLGSEVGEQVAIMYAGRIVEYGAAKTVLSSPRHPYTRGLLASLPRWGARHVDLTPVRGYPPSPFMSIRGCAFHPRCPIATTKCSAVRPDLDVDVDGRLVACHYPGVEAGLDHELATS